MCWLVIGCGSIGKRHISNLKQLGVEDVIVQDVSIARCQEVAQEFGIKTFIDVEEAILQKPEVALVCTPTSLHIQPAILAAQKGCHLFIEKPLSHSMQGVHELLNIVKKNNLITLVGCNMRFHPGVAGMKALLDKGKIGRVLCARLQGGSYLPDWHPWEDYRLSYSARKELGGGVILDGIHELDYIRWFLGEVEEVSCVAGKLSELEIETEDMAEILLKFSSGAVAEVHLDYLQRAYSRSCQLIGEEGTILWDFNENDIKYYLAESKEWQICPLEREPDVNRMYIEEMKHFIACLSGKENPAQDVFQGKKALQIALAARDSSARGRTIRLNSE